MKKVFALLMVSAFAVAIVACGGKKEETATTPVDTTAVEAPTPADTLQDDSTVVEETTADDSAE